MAASRRHRSETRRSQAYPLSGLSIVMQERVAREVAGERPPSKWLEFRDENGRPLAAMESRGWWEWHWQRGIDPEKKRESIPTYMRQRVIARDGYVCQLCGGDVEPTDVHLDHIHPYSKGGPTTVANLQVTHSLCNIRKGARV